MNSSGFERFIFHGNTRNSNGSVSGITKRPSKPPSTKTFKNALCLHESVHEFISCTCGYRIASRLIDHFNHCLVLVGQSNVSGTFSVFDGGPTLF